MRKAAYVDAITLKMGSGEFKEVYNYLQENAGMFPALVMQAKGEDGDPTYFTFVSFTSGTDSKGFLLDLNKEVFINYLGKEKAQEMFDILDTLLLLEN